MSLEAYSETEPDKFFRECNAEYRLLFSFDLKTGFRMQEVMYLQYSDFDFVHHTASVKAKPAYGFIPEAMARADHSSRKRKSLKELEMRRSERKASGLVFPTRTEKATRSTFWPSNGSPSVLAWMRLSSSCTSSGPPLPRIGSGAGLI